MDLSRIEDMERRFRRGEEVVKSTRPGMAKPDRLQPRLKPPAGLGPFVTPE